LLITALAQLRFAASLIFGARLSPWALDQIIDAMLETRREFGGLGADQADIVSGPELDEETRQDIQLRRFRAQAARAARETVYYAPVFDRLGLDPRRMQVEDIARIPRTPKAALRTAPDTFVRRTSEPVLLCQTTGTTGRSTVVAFSTHELKTMTALSAMGFLSDNVLAPDDVVQISTSSRATLGNLGLAGACARIGATAYLTGIIDPARSLALLVEERSLPGKKRRASVLSISPSYLGVLVETGQRLGYHPSDFGLECIFVGGEVVTAGLKARARAIFGPVVFSETYASVETIPFGGTLCADGHLHFHPSHGMVEVLDPESGAPVHPGEIGTIVATPFPPFRETTMLIRYNTEDLVRAIEGPLTCPLRSLPATSPVLGKLRLAVRHAGGWTCPRDILEAIEAVESVPLPARCGFWATEGGVAVETLVNQDTPELRRAIGASLEMRGVPLTDLHLVTDRRHLRRPLPLRCDLTEAEFDDVEAATLGSRAPGDGQKLADARLWAP
jgi:phenylacetate-CoA ligase